MPSFLRCFFTHLGEKRTCGPPSSSDSRAAALLRVARATCFARDSRSLILRRDSASRRFVWVSCFFIELSSCFVSLRARRRISARSTPIPFGTSSALGRSARGRGSVSCRVEPLVPERHSLELAAGTRRRSFLLPSREPLHESADARCVGVPEESASEGRESGSHHHGQIDVLRPVDHALVECERGFVHHHV